MYLVAILSVVTVAILALLSGVVVAVGSRQKKRDHATWFVCLALVVSAWSGAIAAFLGFANRHELSLPLGYAVYALSIVIIFALTAYTLRLLILIRHEKARGRRRRLAGAFVGVLTLDIVVAIFSLVMPRFVSAGWLSVAPIAMSVGLAVLYWAVLKYRVITIQARWLKVLAYLVIIALAAMVYMAIFYVVFTYIFKIEDLPGSIFVLNYVMICAILLIFPVMNELIDSASGLIRANQINMTYIIKKMNKMAPKVDLCDLAAFLADNLHFEYVGFMLDDELIGSDKRRPSQGELEVISDLRDARGEVFGKMAVGRPVGKSRLTRRDLVELEMIVNIVAALIDTKSEVKR